VKSFPATTVGGVLRPTATFPDEMECCIFNGQQYLCYSNADRFREAGHEHWMMAPFKNASLLNAEVAPVIEDARISGVVWTTDWRTLETSMGTYNFTSMLTQLARCQALGKRMIVRVLAKTYSGAYTDPGGANPTTLALPDYIVDDHATYGGSANRGGIYKVYLSGSPVGWGAHFETEAVRTRWKALVSAAEIAIDGASAFAGWAGPDESTRSAWTGSGLPAGITQAAVIASNQDLWAHDAETFGASKVWPVVNYVDSLESITASNQAAIDLQAWCATQGMNVALSDVYLVPGSVTQFLQPVYFSTPRSDLAAGGKHLVHIDLLSLGANDAGLGQRMIDLARQSYRLVGAGITAWNPYVASAGGSAAYWTAMQAAIDATD